MHSEAMISRLARRSEDPCTVTTAQPTLSTDQRTFYRENGYVLVEGLLSPAEAAEYRRECHALATGFAVLR